MQEPRLILGLSFGFHDSAAALILNGEILGALQEERMSRKKGDHNFPYRSVLELLSLARVNMDEITDVVFYEKPYLKFERILRDASVRFPYRRKFFQSSISEWIPKKLSFFDFYLKEIPDKDFEAKFRDLIQRVGIKYSHHHLSHAASAYFPSGFDDAAVIVSDAVGEISSMSVWRGVKEDLELIKEYQFPNSVGVIYSAITDFLGFKPNSGEYKVMGLAPFGSPNFRKQIDSLFEKTVQDGWMEYNLNQKILDPCLTVERIRRNLSSLFGVESRIPETEILEIHADIAASLQAFTNDFSIEFASTVHDNLQLDNLVLAGGVALNCVANEQMRRFSGFKNIWIQPAAGDSGAALGAALAFSVFMKEKSVNIKKSFNKARLGRNYSDSEIQSTLADLDMNVLHLSTEELLERAATNLEKGLIVGWFQGRAEFGPRALGNRSILARPDVQEMQKILNLNIKFRETFRPFAPIVLEDRFEEFFVGEKDPYMIRVSSVKDFVPEAEHAFNITNQLRRKRSRLQAITHLDGTARVQTISRNDNELIYSLMKIFEAKTDLPVLINTSFNLRGEPIVYSPLDGLCAFANSKIDYLYIGNFEISRYDISKKLVYVSSERQYGVD